MAELFFADRMIEYLVKDLFFLLVVQPLLHCGRLRLLPSPASHGMRPVLVVLLLFTCRSLDPRRIYTSASDIFLVRPLVLVAPVLLLAWYQWVDGAARTLLW